MEIKRIYYDEFMKNIRKWEDGLNENSLEERGILQVIETVLDILNDSVVIDSPNATSMSKEEFDSKYVDGVVVNCITKEDAEEFLSMAAYFGYCWSTGSSYCDKTFWDSYHKDICYKISSGMYGDIEWFTKTESIKIVVYKSREN